MPYQGFYLNLDRSVERRKHLEGQLAAYGLLGQYTRFPACDGNVLKVKAPGVSLGNVGCFSSHYLLLKAHLHTPTHLHLVEDDVVLSPFVASFIETMAARGVLAPWDLVFTDMLVPIDLRVLQDLSQRFRRCTTLNPDGTVKAVENFAVLPLKDRTFASTASYLVNKNSVGKVAAVLEEAIRSEVPKPIDLFYRQMIQEGRITAACLFPFITSVDLGLSQSSNISVSDPSKVEISLLAATLLRQLFFVHSQPRRLLATCESRLGAGAMDDRDQVLANICRFALSANFEAF